MTVDLGEVAEFFPGLPEGAVPSEGLVLMGYILEDGSPGFAVEPAGEGNPVTMLGLISMAEHNILHLASHPPEAQ